MARFELTVCHIEIIGPFRESSRHRGRLWMLDRGLIRPVLADNGERAEVTADSEQGALADAVGWLETRFGTLSDPPVPCQDPDVHAKADEGAPVRWE